MSEMTVPNQPGLVERLGERARMVRRNMTAMHRWWWWQCWRARFSIESAVLGFQIRNGLPIV
jgi:hypothetical protein